MTEITLTRRWEYEKFDRDIKKYYQPDKKKREATILAVTTNLLPHKKKTNYQYKTTI